MGEGVVFVVEVEFGFGGDDGGEAEEADEVGDGHQGVKNIGDSP